MRDSVETPFRRQGFAGVPLKSDLRNSKGSAPAPGAVFRALAENPGGVKWCAGWA